MDTIPPETEESPEDIFSVEEDTMPSDKKHIFKEPNTKRNALIAVGLFFLAIITYKFVSTMFSSKSVKQKPSQVETVAQKPVVTQPIQQTPREIQPTQPDLSDEVDKKLSSINVGQETLKHDMSTLGNQMEGIGSNMNQLAEKISQLNQSLSLLNAKIDEQSKEIEQLKQRAKPKKTPNKAVRQKPREVITYYVQALIPGRAWLISSKGTTLTVREGSRIPNYGVVKLIDPQQGRVLTTSGKVIKFSQADS